MPKKDNEGQGYFFIIPTPLVEQGDHLKALLYGLIATLANNNGYCWATNKYLAEKLGRKDGSIISQKVKSLEDEGWIQSEVDRKGGNKRKIYLAGINPIAMRKKPKTSTEISKEGSLEISKERSISNRNIKEKDNVILPAEAGGDEINQVFEVFYKSVNPNINYGNKTSRKAAEWLVKKYGLKKTLEITRYSCQVQGQRFAPTITTPYQLKEKMSELAIFGQRQKANAPGVLKI